jgi:hypothetical protein
MDCYGYLSDWIADGYSTRGIMLFQWSMDVVSRIYQDNRLEIMIWETRSPGTLWWFVGDNVELHWVHAR